jgi:hypothetical protein
MVGAPPRPSWRHVRIDVGVMPLPALRRMQEGVAHLQLSRKGGRTFPRSPKRGSQGRRRPHQSAQALPSGILKRHETWPQEQRLPRAMGGCHGRTATMSPAANLVPSRLLARWGTIGSSDAQDAPRRPKWEKWNDAPRASRGGGRPCLRPPQSSSAQWSSFPSCPPEWRLDFVRDELSFCRFRSPSPQARLEE